MDAHDDVLRIAPATAKLYGAASAGVAGGGALASIPLLVSGTLKSPSARPDMQAVAKSFAKQQLSKLKGLIH
ncbi:MAG: hypothetical protein ACREUT_19745 [Steroidobacteraceae bacterium]